jgi:hypothetical protein
VGDRNGAALLEATITVSNLFLCWLAVIAALPLAAPAEQWSARNRDRTPKEKNYESP